MRLALLTSIDRGFASLCVPELMRAKGCEIAVVILASGNPPSRLDRLRRIVRKTRKIGLRGALNGLAMRRWYTRDVADRLKIRSITDVARGQSLRLETTPSVNAQRTIELFRESNVDLGLSLGNAFISPSVFTIPRLGMINVHHELLPEFQGAQSVIWRLHEGFATTGYTIHRIEERIDTGDILAREEMPILFGETLAQTVAGTYASLLTRSAAKLAEVVGNYDRFLAQASPQREGRRFTTPSWKQFQKMLAEQDRLRRRSGAML
jgi:methionyl-tRNA formyltransferase